MKLKQNKITSFYSRNNDSFEKFLSLLTNEQRQNINSVRKAANEKRKYRFNQPKSWNISVQEITEFPTSSPRPGKLTRCVTRETSSKTLISRVLNQARSERAPFPLASALLLSSVTQMALEQRESLQIRSREAREGLETFSNLPLAHVTCRNFEFDRARSRPNFRPAHDTPDNGNRCFADCSRRATQTTSFHLAMNQTSRIRSFCGKRDRERERET